MDPYLYIFILYLGAMPFAYGFAKGSRVDFYEGHEHLRYGSWDEFWCLSQGIMGLVGLALILFSHWNKPIRLVFRIQKSLR